MSNITFEFPVDEMVERFREVVREEMAVMGNIGNNNTGNEKPVTTKELCDFLGITEPTVIRWRQKGKIPFFQIGSAVRYNLAEVMDSLKKK